MASFARSRAVLVVGGDGDGDGDGDGGGLNFDDVGVLGGDGDGDGDGGGLSVGDVSVLGELNGILRDMERGEWNSIISIRGVIINDFVVEGIGGGSFCILEIDLSK
ncbi:hypothetical protein LIER_35659 [Lithospermum erythrorhizon]|uniref:Uncharacterized protein n=1 Tax=Lithospermum erythrorhizon TaxID=34254 RepID=A0AAV3NU92_LITER